MILNGCVVTLVHYQAKAKIIDPRASYPPVDPGKVYFFPSKDDFPQEIYAAKIAELVSPMNSNWNYDDLLREFRKKAGELGANAIVLERVDTENAGLSSLIYKGSATAYRLRREDPAETLDPGSFYKATQNPDPPQNKTRVIYSYPGMSAQ